MNKILNYDELMAFALENYTKGGDFVYECWGKREFNDYVKEFGPITKQEALNMFALNLSIYDEYQATIW